MKIFDFHTHPGYDYHDEERGYVTTPPVFTDGLKKMGVTFCAGTTIHKKDSYRELADFAEIVPRLNAEAYAFYEMYPEFFTTGIHIHPAYPELSLAEIEKYAAKGVRLIGELVPYMMKWNSYSAPELDEIWRAAAKHDMVVSVHPTTLEDLDRFARRHPDLRIVVAHLNKGDYAGQMELLKRNGNLWIDVSAHADDREGLVRDAIDTLGRERILYGSDYPGYPDDRFIRAVEKECRSDAEREDIFWNNAYRLLFGDKK